MLNYPLFFAPDMVLQKCNTSPFSEPLERLARGTRFVNLVSSLIAFVSSLQAQIAAAQVDEAADQVDAAAETAEGASETAAAAAREVA